MAQTETQFGTLAAYFENSADATKALEALHEVGFTPAQIGVAHRNVSATSSPASGSSGSLGEKPLGTWDKIKNMFSGNEAEPYADERTQGDFANREVTQNPAERGRPTGAYGTSNLHQSFNDLQIPEERSRYFSHRLGKGTTGTIITVQAGARMEEAESILIEHGADLGNKAESYDYGSTDVGGAQAEGNIHLLGEVLRVHKDRVNRGEVTIRKEVLTETQTVQVPVTREELVIERRAVTGTTPAVGTIGESEIRIPLSEERASIDKSTVVREEVSVGKRTVEDIRHLSGDLRHEELVVENPIDRVKP